MINVVCGNKSSFRTVFEEWETLLESYLNNIPGDDALAIAERLAFQAREGQLFTRHGWSRKEFMNATQDKDVHRTRQ